MQSLSSDHQYRLFIGISSDDVALLLDYVFNTTEANMYFVVLLDSQRVYSILTYIDLNVDNRTFWICFIESLSSTLHFLDLGNYIRMMANILLKIMLLGTS